MIMVLDAWQRGFSLPRQADGLYLDIPDQPYHPLAFRQGYDIRCCFEQSHLCQDS